MSSSYSVMYIYTQSLVGKTKERPGWYHKLTFTCLNDRYYIYECHRLWVGFQSNYRLLFFPFPYINMRQYSSGGGLSEALSKSVCIKSVYLLFATFPRGSHSVGLTPVSVFIRKYNSVWENNNFTYAERKVLKGFTWTWFNFGA